MKIRYLLCLLVLCLAAFTTAQAKKKKNRPNFKVVEAYTQRIVPGMRPSPQHPAPPPETHIIIVWEGKVHPDAFFWSGNAQAVSCNVAKARRATNTGSHGAGGGKEYYTQPVAADAIVKDDTLDVTPIPGSPSFVAPDVPFVSGKTNTLFSEVNLVNGVHAVKLNWVQIDTIVKKRDILMP